MDESTASEICLHWVQIQTDKGRYHIPGPRFITSSFFSSYHMRSILQNCICMCVYVSHGTTL